MAIESVKKYLSKYNKDKDVIEFDSSSATVRDASQVIGCLESEIAKTLSFLVEDHPILIVMAGDKKCDNKKFKNFFGKKAKMIPSELLISLIGHEAGGVCPFGVNDNVQIYLDVSLKEHSILYPACGNSHSAIKLSLEELEHIVNYVDWIDVSI